MKTKKTKEAVSLIVLVLTIVIMIILAGVIIINLNNSGIINRGKTAVSETNLKQMQEMATIAWGELIIEDVDAIIDEQAIKSKLILSGIDSEELEKYIFNVTSGGVEVIAWSEIDPLNPSGIIPKGAVYYRYDELPGGPSEELFDIDMSSIEDEAVSYTEGQQFPDTLETGDVYVYGKYIYVYNGVLDGNYDTVFGTREMNGWGVSYIGNSEIPGELLESINGAPLKAMDYTFSINNMITTAPIIPASVVWMTDTFMDCYSLTGTITINANPIDYTSCFYGCDMSNITLTGTSTMLDKLAATAE